ncbi:unnamed protein product [Candidula unifasciata]|uniref:Sulfatase N-terminal domain-containing protein n=1 Tax=Candidula unifasciata TaxID=100452 RepID=A0A8S3YNK0_9EUPU|nr:unnamed protein product [Candidula unifasciata]
MPRLLWSLACWLLLPLARSSRNLKPNIVFIMVDDLGYNDVGYHRSHIRTPEIDRLSKEGVRLENYYVQPICTPTRSVFMSGRYQIHTGLQHGVIGPTQAMALPLGSPTLADKLSQAGYATYAVGKWHLGFYKRKFLPTRRGFDRFYGFYTGAGDYFRHNRCLKGGCGVDLHDDTKDTFANVFNESGTYSTHLYTQKAIDLIQAHNVDKPFFLYLAYQAVHGPLQVPHNYKQEYLHIPDPNRRTFAAMTSALDQGIGKLVQALKHKGVWNNTVLVLSTDNGADPSNGGSNWPYRGRKGEWFEGGVKGVGFVSSPLLDKQRYANKALIHVADWFPTFIRLANANMSDTHDVAGVDQWDVISKNAQSKKIMILHGIDPLTKSVAPAGKYSSIFDARMSAALRIGDYKLITGPCAEGKCKRRINKPNKFMISRNQYRRKSKYRGKRRHKRKQRPLNKHVKHMKNTIAGPARLVQLYNIRRDPLEKHDLSRRQPNIVRKMLEKLQEFYVTSVSPCYPKNEKVAPVQKAWGPWREGKDHHQYCPMRKSLLANTRAS